MESRTRLAEKLCLVAFRVCAQFSARPNPVCRPTLVRTLDGAPGTHFPFPREGKREALILKKNQKNQQQRQKKQGMGDSGLAAFPNLPPLTPKSKGGVDEKEEEQQQPFFVTRQNSSL